MPVTTINAVNTEFATATGANYNAYNGRSGFDTPLTQNTNLTITSEATDTSPYLFDIGETYDLTWVDSGVTNTMADAVVVRSDAIGGGGGPGIVVFQGVDQFGAPTHVLWTAGFNVHQWHANIVANGGVPTFWNGDRDTTETYGYICFAAEARVLTRRGPVPAGVLAPGDLVWSLDRGLVPLRWIGRRRSSGLGEGAPVLFASGTLGNLAPLRLSPQHRVVLSGPAVEEHAGAPEVLVPAKALAGRAGVRRAACDSLIYVNFLCDDHEVVLAEGAACETLWLGDEALKAIWAGTDPGTDQRGDFGPIAAAVAARAAGPGGATGAGGRPRESARPMFSVGQAKRLLAALGDAPLVAERHEMDVPEFGPPGAGPALSPRVLPSAGAAGAAGADQSARRSTSSTRTFAPGSAIREIGTPVEAGPGRP